MVIFQILYLVEFKIVESIMYYIIVYEMWEEVEMRYGKFNGIKIF